MQSLMRAAKAPKGAINEVPSLVQGCDLCRQWQKPPPHTVVAVRLIKEFNQEVQMDLWFYNSLIDKPELERIVMHLIDACVRWSQNGQLPDRTEISLCTKISTMWITHHGPMTVLVQDGESAMKGRSVADWAEANRTKLKYVSTTWVKGVDSRTTPADAAEVGPLHRRPDEERRDICTFRADVSNYNVCPQCTGQGGWTHCLQCGLRQNTEPATDL